MTSDIAARLVGPLSVDRYVATGDDLPGGGVLNMAYHWAQRDIEFELVSRIAVESRRLFDEFLARHTIATTPDLAVAGEPCTIDIRFAADRQPKMDNFVEGILADFRLTDSESERLVGGTPAHLVLVDVIDHELHRLVASRSMNHAVLTGDFLSFGHFTIERFAATMAHLDVGFIGWPGRPDDPELETLAEIAERTQALLVITFGSQGIRTIDSRSSQRDDRWFDVDAIAVSGTTVGCGDAFIAGFLSEWIASEHLDNAIDAGRSLGAAATTWTGPLPESAYG